MRHIVHIRHYAGSCLQIRENDRGAINIIHIFPRKQRELIGTDKHTQRRERGDDSDDDDSTDLSLELIVDEISTEDIIVTNDIIIY
jgi:hypothetical protein